MGFVVDLGRRGLRAGRWAVDPSVTSPLCAANAASTCSSPLRNVEEVERSGELAATASNSSGAIWSSRWAASRLSGSWPGLVATYSNGPPATWQTHSVRMNFKPGRRASFCGVPLAELRVVGTLPGDLVPDDRVAEMVDDRGNGEDATESLVQALLAHVDPPLSSRSRCTAVVWSDSTQGLTNSRRSLCLGTIGACARTGSCLRRLRSRGRVLPCDTPTAADWELQRSGAEEARTRVHRSPGAPEETGLDVEPGRLTGIYYGTTGRRRADPPRRLSRRLVADRQFPRPIA